MMLERGLLLEVSRVWEALSRMPACTLIWR
jgi:hypothetical protein